MSKMALTDEALARYRATMRRRTEEDHRRRRERATRAHEAAREAAHVLEEDFGAARVVLFGSVAAGERLGMRSDVDLAVWGLTPVEHLEAVARLQGCSPDFSIDLIRMERCGGSLREAIMGSGVPL